MESTHTILQAIQKDEITALEALCHLLPSYDQELDLPKSVQNFEQYLIDYFNEDFSYPPDLIDFRICFHCMQLMLWDDFYEDFRHMAAFAGEECRDKKEAAPFVLYLPVGTE